MNFKERLKPTVTTKALLSSVPFITISKQAITKMFIYVDECAKEVGWMGTAYRDGQHIIIDDVYLFDQEVHATTTEITPEGLSDFAMELLNKPDGMDIWNNLKMWGHSHVNMGITPSAQDDSQMEKFQEGGHDWFIRLIANKRGEMKVDLYDYSSGVIYLDLPWQSGEDEAENELLEQIALLQKQLNTIRKEYTDTLRGAVQAEMKVKVREKTYPINNSVTSNWQNRNVQTTANLQDDDEKKTNVVNTGKNAGKAANLNTEDYFQNDDQVIDAFSLVELYEVYNCRGFNETDELLCEYGWFDTFSDDDIERIMRVANKKIPLVYGEYANKNKPWYGGTWD
jgi:hypothetical protein